MSPLTFRNSLDPDLSLRTRGPQANIFVPSGAVMISPGTDIQTVVTANPNGTTFGLRSGVHYVTSDVIPKTGNTFVGELGAILDGVGWSAVKADWSNNAAFRAHNADIDDVTIRNLHIRNIPGSGIAAFHDFSNRWTVEYCELSYCNKVGVALPNNSIARANYIHHCVGDLEDPDANFNGGGYLVNASSDVVFENNEISYNGPEQKAFLASGVVFRGNWFHHNYNQGVWYDGDNPNFLVEDNLIEDNGSLVLGGVGIFFENSGYGTVRRNIIRRQGWQGISLTTTRDTEIYENLLEDCGRGITLNVFCGSPIGAGTIPGGFDLTNNYVHHNTIKVGSGLVWASDYVQSECSGPEYAAYFDGITNKDNLHDYNAYHVPSTSGSYWRWITGTLIDFAAWQGNGQDLNGSVILR